MSGPSTSLVMRQVRVVDPLTQRDEVVDLVVRDGIVQACAKDAAASEPDALPGHGTVLLPSLIDLRADLGEPGREYREELHSGLRAAAAGGFGHVCALPTGVPVNDDPLVTRGLLSAAAGKRGSRVLSLAALTRGLEGNELAPLGLLKEAGAVGFTDADHFVRSSSLMLRLMQYVSGFDGLVLQAPRDPSLTAQGLVHESRLAFERGLAGIPTLAEVTALQRDLALAQASQVRFHAHTLSSAEGVALMRQAKQANARVSCSVGLHHLVLDESSGAPYSPRHLFQPPLRAARDRIELLSGLRDGTIDCIVTDHCPRSTLETDAELDQVHSGAVGFEVALPKLWRLTVASGDSSSALSALRLVDALSCAPSRVLQLPLPSISEGKPANFVWFDPRQRWTPAQGRWYSRSKNSPFFHEELKGRVLLTALDGCTIYPFEENS